jgi:glucoamylase
MRGGSTVFGGLDLSKGTEFTIGLAFGTTQHDALSTLMQSLSIPFKETSFVRMVWGRFQNDSKLFERSINLLLAH